MNSNDERNLPALPEGRSMQVWAGELVARAREEGVELVGDWDLLTGLLNRALA